MVWNNYPIFGQQVGIVSLQLVVTTEKVQPIKNTLDLSYNG